MVSDGYRLEMKTCQSLRCEESKRTEIESLRRIIEKIGLTGNINQILR